MKQKRSTILLSLLTLFSFALGHADVHIKPGWTEPVIVWIAIVLKTGRCKSALHKFVEEIVECMKQKLHDEGTTDKTLLLPHCTWDKFGDILANNGGKVFGLFDELISFFPTMNMYSASKSSVQDNREYQDFLQMFTGKAKNRETVTGNANYRINQTSFTLLGFTQPQSAMPIIEDQQNNSKGFTSRVLWFFPQPIYCRLEDLDVTEDEQQSLQEFKEELLNNLSHLYHQSEKSYTLEEIGKVVDANVTRKHWHLSPPAKQLFYTIYGDWELNVCLPHQHDSLISGLFARGNSHVIRLSLPLHLLLSMFEEPTESQPSTSSAQEHDHDNTIGLPAVKAAHSIVTTCLKHVVLMNGKLLNANNEVTATKITNPSPHLKPRRTVLLSPGKLVSASYLLQKSKFRNMKVANLTGANLAKETFKNLADDNIGTIEKFHIRRNNVEVIFFTKKQPPVDETELTEFAQLLLRQGVTLQEYEIAYIIANEESNKHIQEYEKRKEEMETPSNPEKRTRVE